jgi:hypothetical protein
VSAHEQAGIDLVQLISVDGLRVVGAEIVTEPYGADVPPQRPRFERCDSRAMATFTILTRRSNRE